MKQAALVFIVGLVVALLWTFVVFPRFSPINQVFDLNKIGSIGERIYLGQGFSLGDGPTMRRAPVYPYFIAGVFTVFGLDPVHPEKSYIPVLIIQCWMAGLTCVGVYFLALRVWKTPKIAMTAGFMAAIWPQCIRYVGAIDVECVMTMLITWMALSAARLYQSPTVLNGVLMGLVLGIATLVKPMPMLFPAVVALLLLIRARREKTRFAWAPMAATVGVMVVLCLPWIMRNHSVSGGRFKGISTNAAGEFIRGYVNAQPKFAFLKERFEGNWDWQANLYEDELLKQHGSSFFLYENGERKGMPWTIDVELTKDTLEGKIAKEMVLSNPLGFLRKFVIQCFTFWYLVETPGKSLLVGSFALVALFLTGVAWRKAGDERQDMLPVIFTVLYFNFLYAAFLAFARYSMPIYPTLIVLSAGGLCRLFANSPARQGVAAPASQVQSEGA
jgi:4-amino-4-deoxy-L-arabinose transferase-like glycosyltransferase